MIFNRWQEERRDLEAELGERITLDALTWSNELLGREAWQDDAGGAAGWLIAQRKGGHRHSIDDVLTAWYALQISPPVREHLDLGTGIGTVGLLTLWGMGPEARLTCVEAQDISYRLLQSNLDANGLRSRVDASQGACAVAEDREEVSGGFHQIGSRCYQAWKKRKIARRGGRLGRIEPN